MSARYSNQTLEALEHGYEYHWILDESLTQEDIDLFDRLCDRIREHDHLGSCWDLMKVFDQFAHEYCRNVKEGKVNE